MAMKRLRYVCLAVILGLVLANPGLAFSTLDGGNCCQAFKTHCELDVCSGHGGMLITNCYGLYCTETCWCMDDTIHVDPCGTWCDPIET
jgi:hypothetical protein